MRVCIWCRIQGRANYVLGHKFLYVPKSDSRHNSGPCFSTHDKEYHFGGNHSSDHNLTSANIHAFQFLAPSLAEMKPRFLAQRGAVGSLLLGSAYIYIYVYIYMCIYIYV